MTKKELVDSLTRIIKVLTVNELSEVSEDVGVAFNIWRTSATDITSIAVNYDSKIQELELVIYLS